MDLTLAKSNRKIEVMLLLLLIIAAQISLAVFFIRYVTKNDRGSKEPRSAIKAAIGCGFLALILVMIVTGTLSQIPGLKELANADPESLQASGDLGFVMLAMLLVGVIEESAKAIPLALFIYKKPYFNELTDGIFYFGITGIVFSVCESILYTLKFGVEVGTMRLVLTPFLHTGFSMWFGFALARRKVLGRGNSAVVAALGAAIILHSMYNFGLASGDSLFALMSLGIAIGLNIGVFKLYRYAQRKDAKLALSADGSNNFCRHCGKPNLTHTLFCEYCGQKA